MTSTARIRELICQQFAIAAELTRLTERPFTLDGHMVGSAGEVLARLRFDLKLTDPSTKGIDAIALDGRRVEIKATGGTRGVALRGLQPLADHLLVLTISAEGQEAVIYNGPAIPVWDAIAHKSMPDNGQRGISLARLRELQQTVVAEQMLPEVA
jgi:hypothetical protein